MTIVIIAMLALLSFYLGARLHAATTENSTLRANVTVLKRRLGQR